MKSPDSGSSTSEYIGKAAKLIKNKAVRTTGAVAIGIATNLLPVYDAQAETPTPTPTKTATPTKTPTASPTPTSTPNVLATEVARDRAILNTEATQTALQKQSDDIRRQREALLTPSATPTRTPIPSPTPNVSATAESRRLDALGGRQAEIQATATAKAEASETAQARRTAVAEARQAALAESRGGGTNGNGTTGATTGNQEPFLDLGDAAKTVGILGAVALGWRSRRRVWDSGPVRRVRNVGWINSTGDFIRNQSSAGVDLIRRGGRGVMDWFNNTGTPPPPAAPGGPAHGPAHGPVVPPTPGHGPATPGGPGHAPGRGPRGRRLGP